MKLILGGHWTSAPEGWSALKEADQDITKALSYADDSVDAIFTEHVVEHVSFIHGVHFMREALRVLKPGGVFRVVAPMLETILDFDDQNELSREYGEVSIAPYYRAEVEVLKSLGLSLHTDLHPFLVDSMVRKHGHQFVWSMALMHQVLDRLGFKEVKIASPGRSAFDETTCLERKIRGVYADKAQANGTTVWDCESGVVEARK